MKRSTSPTKKIFHRSLALLLSPVLLIAAPALGETGLPKGVPNFKIPGKLHGPDKVKKLERMELESKEHKDTSRTLIGLGVVLGSSATYGNGLVLNVDPVKFVRAQAGAGYNSTGMKAGAAGAFLLPFSASLGMDIGGALVHSFGTKDEVSLPAKFTAESSSSAEKVDAVRKFRLSPSNYYSVFLGPYFALARNFWVEAHVNYNKVIAGNDVDFYDGVSYSTPIEASNEEAVQKDFEKKAREKLDINGIGFSLGVQVRI